MKKNPKVICITGGKGGTGKTLVAVNLAIMFNNAGKKVLLLDGDVENPNSYLLLGGELENRKEVPFFIPKINEEQCVKCGLCAENCLSHSLIHVNGGFPVSVPTLCNGCKLCYKICPENAIDSAQKVIGWTYSSQKNSLSYYVGELNPGEARSAAIIESLLFQLEKVIKEEPNKFDIIILDTAPGAHCDVELLLEQADYIIPVTEPTRFGKLDLQRIIELIDLLGKDYRIIVNRSTLLGFREAFIKDLDESNIKILGDIPLNDDIVHSYCEGIPLMNKNSKYSRDGKGVKAFEKIFSNLNSWLTNGK